MIFATICVIIGALAVVVAMFLNVGALRHAGLLHDAVAGGMKFAARGERRVTRRLALAAFIVAGSGIATIALGVAAKLMAA